MRDIGEISVHTLIACYVRRIYHLQRSSAGGAQTQLEAFNRHSSLQFQLAVEDLYVFSMTATVLLQELSLR